MWISTSDRLPEAEKRVLVVVRNPNGTRFVCIGEHIPKHTVRAEDFLDWESDLIDECDIVDEVEYVAEGWWEWALEGETIYRFSGTVEHWAPMPSLPVDGGGEA